MNNHAKWALVTGIVIALVGAVAVPAIAKSTRPRAQAMFDSASYHGASTSLALTAQGRNRVYIRNVRATLQMPRRYANRFCAYAELRVDERTVATSYTDCDTNGDARLRFYLPSMWVRPNAQVSVYFSDAVTRYLATHPWISV